MYYSVPGTAVWLCRLRSAVCGMHGCFRCMPLVKRLQKVQSTCCKLLKWASISPQVCVGVGCLVWFGAWQMQKRLIWKSWLTHVPAVMEGGTVQLGGVITTAAGAPTLCACTLVDAVACQYGHIWAHCNSWLQPPQIWEDKEVIDFRTLEGIIIIGLCELVWYVYHALETISMQLMVSDRKVTTVN